LREHYLVLVNGRLGQISLLHVPEVFFFGRSDCDRFIGDSAAAVFLEFGKCSLRVFPRVFPQGFANFHSVMDSIDPNGTGTGALGDLPIAALPTKALVASAFLMSTIFLWRL
jgi:hypothetical protein